LVPGIKANKQPFTLPVEIKMVSMPVRILNSYRVRLLEGNWDSSGISVVNSTFRMLQQGLDRITNGRGREWIHKNLGDARISAGTDRSMLGSHLVMTRLFSGRSHVIRDRVYLAAGFQEHAWRVGRSKADLWIIHELAHVWDNRSAHGWGSILGGGYGDELLGFLHGSAGGLLGLRFVDRSLTLDSAFLISADGNLAYANNSPADYFAQVFVAAVSLPYAPGVSAIAKDWMIELIKRTT
jgi:hypothetical protein